MLQSQTSANATQYVYALGTRPLAQYGNAWEYLLADALGSVRQIVDANGNVTLAESYEPYGSVLSSNGTASSIFGYSGEEADTSGLVYLRARYMQPTLDIFLARDPWSGDQMRPGSMNGWSYASANPVNRIDPSGMTDLATLLAIPDEEICKNSCIECIPFGPPLGENVVFVQSKLPSNILKWTPWERQIVELTFTGAMNRYSGLTSGGLRQSGNQAFGSLPVALTQLKVSVANPMRFWRGADHGNSPAGVALPSKRLWIYDLFFTHFGLNPVNSTSGTVEQEGTLAHEIAHYWNFDNRLSGDMVRWVNFYKPPLWNSEYNPYPKEYFSDAVTLYLYDELAEPNYVWTDDVGAGLVLAKMHGVGRDGLHAFNNAISVGRSLCDLTGTRCQDFPPTGDRMQDAYDFVENLFNDVRSGISR